MATPCFIFSLSSRAGNPLLQLGDSTEDAQRVEPLSSYVLSFIVIRMLNLSIMFICVVIMHPFCDLFMIFYCISIMLVSFYDSDYE